MSDEAETNGDWTGVEADIAKAMTRHEGEYKPTILGNLSDLLALLRSTGRPRPVIEPGYWPTFRLSWGVVGAENLEIEIFEERYEVYRFFDGRTDIRHEEHRPGQAISPALIADLPGPLP